MVLVLYLDAMGLDAITVGIVLTLTLIGDTVISLWLTTNADHFGRRRILVGGALLMVVAGIVFAATDWVPLLILAATIGVISPTGNEVGPFLAVEQASLSQTVPDGRRTATFAWYNLAGYVATATGALGAGLLSQVLLDRGAPPVDAYRAIVIGYAVFGAAMALGFSRLGPTIEAPPRATATDGIRRRLGLGRSKGIVLRLVAAVQPRRLRRRVHPAEPHGLLVPHTVRRRSRGARGSSSSPPTSWPRCRRCRPPGSPPGSA